MLSLKSLKSNLTREIKALQEYVNDCNNEIANQYPQPNGDICLHGDVIAVKIPHSGIVIKKRIFIEAQRELAKMISKRKSMNDSESSARQRGYNDCLNNRSSCPYGEEFELLQNAWAHGWNDAYEYKQDF